MEIYSSGVVVSEEQNYVYSVGCCDNGAAGRRVVSKLPATWPPSQWAMGMERGIDWTHFARFHDSLERASLLDCY